MWTGEKIIFDESSVIVPFFKEMGPDSYEFATDDYFLYATLTSLACYRLTSPRAQGTLANIFSRSGTLTHLVLAWTCITYTWKDPPHRFFFQKMSKSQNRPFSLGNAIFFRLRAATPPYRIRAAATAAASENFGHGGVKGRDFSLDFNSSEKNEGTLPEELDRAEAIPGVSATSK